ncbi:MAG: cation-binding protein [Candidatus Cloacimonadota bacterium]|nr:MAG: cation-binding protein [Candidatus Cloacimonadota bacterium]
MIEVSSRLMQEHQLILKYIDLLYRYVDSDKNNLFLEKAPLFVQFIKEFADKYHHAKEENILFKALEEPGVLTHCNPVGQMLHEHDLGRQFVTSMIEACDKSDIHSLKENAKNYGLLLRDHIFKEDKILYPMAETNLSEEAKLAIAVEYQKVEDELDGDKIYKNFKTLYDELELAIN